MNNGSLHMKNSSRTTSISDQTLKQNSKQDNSIDLTDVSIISVGLTRYQQYNHRMLTDDEEDIEDETSDEDDDDDEDDRAQFISHSHLTLNSNHDDLDLGPIDPDTQAKLAAILEATGITNAPIPDDFWNDQQVVRLLTSSVTNNFNGIHEIANALSSSSTNNSNHLNHHSNSNTNSSLTTTNATGTNTSNTGTNQTDKKSKLMNKDSGVLLRACVNNDIPTVEKILQRKNIKEYLNDINEDGDSILSLACSNGYTDLVDLILRTIPDIAVNDRGNKQDCTPLMEACNAGHYDIVELLIKYNANVNIQSTSGNTALHYAAGGGYVDIVQLLLRHGAKVEETNENGHTPLMEAAGGGHVEVTQVLLDHGAGVNVPSKDKNGNEIKERKTDEMHTALMEACMDGHVQVARLLLDHGADVNMPPDSYESPLTLSACGGHFELASLLIERGANLEEVNDEGYTPLMEASREGHDDIVNLLISKGANVNRTTEEAQETALTLACAGGFMDVVKILLANGADINLGQSTPLMEASQEGHIELVQYLIENGANVQQKTRTDDTALGYACESGHTEVAEILINAGAPIDQPENEGRTPLMKAARAGHTCTVRYLIGKGADVNRTTYNNDASVLSLACAGGHFEIATILLLHEANPNHLLKDRSNCLIEAAKGGHTAIVQLLLEYPKSILNCTIHPLESQSSTRTHDDENGGVTTTTVEHDDADDDDDDDDECDDDDENLTARMPNSFPLPSPPMNNSSFALLERLEKIVPRNILEVLRTVNPEENDFHVGNEPIDIDHATCSWASIDRVSSTTNEETSVEDSQQAKKLYLLEQLQHVEKELHDKAQEHLKLNQEYRQQVSEHLNSHASVSQSTPAAATTTAATTTTTSSSKKKKRTTSSSSTSSSSSVTSSSSSTDKPDERCTPLPPYAIPSQTINFFSTPTIESNPSTSNPSPHHHYHHSKIKKSLSRQLSKSDRRIEQHIQENQNHLNEMNHHFKNLQLLSSSTGATTTTTSTTDGNTTKLPMRINTDTQKALEHLRQLASNPSDLERIQTLANNPTLLKKIQKLADQQRAVQSSSAVEKPVSSTDHESNNRLESTENVEHSLRTGSSCVDHPNPVASLSHLRYQNRIDVDCQTESNHDTALTLACAGGHEELVLLLLQRNANIEHRDKKGFTPLILAATAGHANIVARLLEHGANIEAQSERTKDTALSLACSGGRQEVVEVLLKNGANREHRNVSDYTALSLAASGGYVNIIRLLLNHGAEINSRTGSKLGITPLMLASMNGHVAAVKLLLENGADINAQIETNRNTALTLACFQGRAEIVSLLVDRKANIEHRAKTGLTPLMESASGGYVDVGRVLLERGADVNAAPVPTSKDTALTIAADKGHHKFVELLLQHGATIDVRNKKGATPLWLACNSGHLEVVQLLITRHADPDACDSRKVSCLMAAFRKGHIKVVKYLVRQVRQFPSDADCRRLISTITDKDLLKRCHTCMDQIISAKERQAAEANKAANSLLKEIDLEKSREQTRKVAAAKKREKRKAKKKGKQQTATNQVEESSVGDEVAEVASPSTAPVETEIEPIVEIVSAPPTTVEVVVEDDPRIQLMKNEEEQKAPSPEPIVKQSNKKKTNTMTRKMERHQENLASKNKQQHQQQESPVAVMNPNSTDDGWQEVIGKQKKVVIHHEQYSRIVGRSGSNLNVLREVTGASIEVENKGGIGDKTILIKGNGDSIKHAYQLIMALLKNSESELMSLLPASNKIKTSSNITTHDHDEETIKTQRTNTGPRFMNNESNYADASSLSRNHPRTSNQSNRKAPSTASTRSISSSAPIKHPQPLTSTGATWVNSNRSNRAISSSSSSTTNATTINPTNWSHPKSSSSSTSFPKPPNAYPSSHSRGYSSHSSLTNTNDVTLNPSHSTGTAPYRTNSQPISSLLVAAPPISTATGEYNPFASNILTTSLVDVLTKPKEATNAMSNTSDESTTKMNFANVAKMHMPIKTSSHPEPLIAAPPPPPPTSMSSTTSTSILTTTSTTTVITTTNELTSPPIQSDPKIAPGYRGPPSTTPIQQLIAPNSFDALSPNAQMNRAPGSNRTHASVSPSVNKIHLDQNGQTGSSTASSTSSSPSSFKQATGYYQPTQPTFQQMEQTAKPPYGPIGSYRPTTSNDDALIQMAGKFPPGNPPMYRPMPPSQASLPPTSLLLGNAQYANTGHNRSNLNPSAPEFLHSTPMNNGPMTGMYMPINRLREQPTPTSVPPALYAPAPMPPGIRTLLNPDMESRQYMKSQPLNIYQVQLNQQQQQQQVQPGTGHHAPPLPSASAVPPQPFASLPMMNVPHNGRKLLNDPTQAATMMTNYLQSFAHRQPILTSVPAPNQVPPTNNLNLASNVNTAVYETINSHATNPNSDDLSLNSVDPINGHVQSQVLVDPTGIMTNSNHSTGPLLPPSSMATSTGGDHKMVPAAIGSERKRQTPITHMSSFVAHPTPNEWPSGSKPSYPQYQTQTQTRDYHQ